jgi:6-pyruvoyltetrahydropterin/6-carboxytetrahydropterin synthase
MAKFREARRLARVDHQRLRFAAAHMATFGGAIEPLHGHNYAVTIEVEGDLDVDDGWVVDFGVLKRIGSAICERLDHHFLLQCESKALHMSRQAGVWELSFGTKRYLLPADDVFELPVTNTTTEQIAGWFWHEVDEGLRSRSIRTVSHLAVGVEEAPGQAGWFTAATT